MRPSSIASFWIFWIACSSLAIWWISAPAGYFSYAWQWLLHQRFDVIWPQEQEMVSKNEVLPELEEWAHRIGTAMRVDNQLYVHRAGTPIPAPEWRALEERYAARGIKIVDQPSYSTNGSNEDAEALITALFGQQPYALKSLFYAIAHRLSAHNLRHQPRVASVYLMFEHPDLMVHWPGGNQLQRYEDGYSPSLAYSGRELGRQWLDEKIGQDSSFEALSADSLGVGDTMITTSQVSFNGVKGIVAADIYWEESPVGSIRISVIAYSTWAALSALAIVASLFSILRAWVHMFLEGSGVCVTIDIVGWSKIGAIEKRFQRQELLDVAVRKAFTASTRQRIMRWSTGDGYHVLFMDHWGARIYRDALWFARELLWRWDSTLTKGDGEEGGTLRISVGSHGSVRMRRKNGAWYALGDRIVSAVRIDEVAKKSRDAEHNRWVVAIEESFNQEAKITAQREYDLIVVSKDGPIEGIDKAGKKHKFSLLHLKAP